MTEEFLNLWIYSDSKLKDILGEKIETREKLHHWPLSYVEKVTLKNGISYIYKSQWWAASVEMQFYQTVNAPFLTQPIYTKRHKNCDIMLFPYLAYPHIDITSEDHLNTLVTEISAVIQNISEMPVFFDISSPGKLMDLLMDLPGYEITFVLGWLNGKGRRCWDSTVGNVHGDLTPGNILGEDGVIRYILDWQRPMKAPLLLENATAAYNAGYKNYKRYKEYWILSVICRFLWFAYAHKRFLTKEGGDVYAKSILKECAELIWKQ